MVTELESNQYTAGIKALSNNEQTMSNPLNNL